MSCAKFFGQFKDEHETSSGSDSEQERKRELKALNAGRKTALLENHGRGAGGGGGSSAEDAGAGQARGRGSSADRSSAASSPKKERKDTAAAGAGGGGGRKQGLCGFPFRKLTKTVKKKKPKIESPEKTLGEDAESPEKDGKKKQAVTGFAGSLRWASGGDK